MSSKAGTSKRTGEDITKQAKKIKGIDVGALASIAANGWQQLGPWHDGGNSLCTHHVAQEVLRLVKKLAEQSKKENHQDK